MPFNVLFHGLVCHRTEDDMSVFVAAHFHELRMVVRNDDVLSAAGFEVDPEGLHFALRAEGPQTSFRVTDRILEVGGTTPMTSTFTSQFRTHVPSLRRHSECGGPNLNPAVRQRRVTDELAAYLIHSGGAFSVNDFFAEKCTFTGNARDADCIARTIRLTLPTNGKNVTIGDGNGGRFVLKPDAEVRFVNTIPPASGITASNQHFHHYYDAMFDGCNRGREPQEAQTRCRHRHDPSFAVPGGDCANSGDP